MISQIKKISLAASFLVFSNAMAQEKLEHKDLMWGLNNTGRSMNIFMSLLQTYRLQAIAGEDIKLAPAFKGRKVKVAVLDTGVDIHHPALKPYIIRNANKCEALDKLVKCQNEAQDRVSSDKCRADHLQAEENIYPADCHGWSILDQNISNTPNNIIGRPDFKDEVGHGTHVAGVITSVSQNVEIIPVQVIGIGPNQPMKPFSIDLAPNENIRKGYTNLDNLSERISRGIIYAMNAGAEVISMSIGWPEDQNSDIIKEAMAEAQRRGIIIVAAAGNDSTSALLRPCQYKGVICVGAHAPDGSLASFSNFGFGVDIAAPGVEIVSAIPTEMSSVRLLGMTGYEALSGTSQATPYVTGVVADLLSRGVPASEIYPRLILGARAIKPALPVLEGPDNVKLKPIDAATQYKKTILSGLLDMTAALKVSAQTLILPANKDVQVINWDRKSADLNFPVVLKNYWKGIKNQKIDVMVQSTFNSELIPEVVAIEKPQDMVNWSQGEEKSFQIRLKIKDQTDASLSRLPSELSYQVAVYIDGKKHRQFEVKAEVLVAISGQMSGGNTSSFDLVGDVPRGMKLVLVDEVFDKEQGRRDYFIVGNDDIDKKEISIGLVRGSEKSYQIESIQKLKFDGNMKFENNIPSVRPQYRMRIDLDDDGISEYIYGIIEYLDKEATIEGDYRNHFYIFDNNMKLKKYVIFDDKRAALPTTFYWMKINGQLRPAWVGQGQEIVKSWDITDLWAIGDTPEETAANARTEIDIHFYYLDENFKLQEVATQNKGERIVDVVQSTLAQTQRGVVTVLIAKNLGTEVKASYINEFSIANIENAALSGQIKMDNLAGAYGYRNLVDTFASKTASLDSEAGEYQGMMWYGLDTAQRQRVTLIDVEQKRIFDKLISSQRAVYDSALLVKMGYQSKERKAVFLVTNSELEYHDLTLNQVASTSLNRYTFFGDTRFVQLFFPITVIDRHDNKNKLPGLFTTERSGLSRGVRLLIPVYSRDGKLQQMVVPARLRLKSEMGCKPLETPVYLGENSGYAMDYQCGRKILRFLLSY